MADRYQAWVEGAAAERPHLAASLAELGELYHRKLWHQLSVKLEGYLDAPEFQEGGFLVSLYQNFVAGFAHKINLLKLAFFAVAVGKQMASPEVGAWLGGRLWVRVGSAAVCMDARLSGAACDVATGQRAPNCPHPQPPPHCCLSPHPPSPVPTF